MRTKSREFPTELLNKYYARAMLVIEQRTLEAITDSFPRIADSLERLVEILEQERVHREAKCADSSRQ